MFSEYWASLPRREDGIPSRKDFDPSAVRPLLPHLILHDLTGVAGSVLRLVGTRLVERFGFDPTGRNYLSLVEESRRPEALQALRTVVGQPCGMRIVIEWRYVTGYRQWAEAVGFPLSRADGAGRQMMFIDVPIESSVFDDPLEASLTALEVSERDLIDIGSGCPVL